MDTINAQVGINTSEPKATLDVVGEPNTVETLDGVIPPRITADQLSAKTYTTAQTGAMVYVSAIPDTSFNAVNNQTTNVYSSGYYFFDGVQWAQIKDTNKRDGRCVKSPPGTANFPDNSDMGTVMTVGDFDFRWYWVNDNVSSQNSRLEMRKKNSAVVDVAVISKNLGGSAMEEPTFKDITSATEWTQVTNGNFRETDQVGEAILMSNQAQAYRITIGGAHRGTTSFSEFCFYVEQLN